MVTNLSGQVFKGYLPHFPLVFFFNSAWLIDMLHLFFKIIFPATVQLGTTSSFYIVKTDLFTPSVCSILNNPFDSHAGLSPLHQAGISWACKHKRDVLVAPGASKGASLKTPSEEGSTNPLHQKCHRR